MGLSEHRVNSVPDLLELMSKAHNLRSTGSTGANLESSRSHQILQLALQATVVVGAGRQVKSVQKTFGKLSFIGIFCTLVFSVFVSK